MTSLMRPGCVLSCINLETMFPHSKFDCKNSFCDNWISDGSKGED